MAIFGRGCTDPLRGVSGNYSGDPFCLTGKEDNRVRARWMPIAAELDLIECLGKVGD
jgi:hypothetical protein